MATLKWSIFSTYVSGGTKLEDAIPKSWGVPAEIAPRFFRLIPNVFVDNGDKYVISREELPLDYELVYDDVIALVTHDAKLERLERPDVKWITC